MRFIRVAQHVFINAEAIAEVLFSETTKQHPEVGGMKPEIKQTAFIKLLDNSQHSLTGEAVKALRAEIEGASIN